MVRLLRVAVFDNVLLIYFGTFCVSSQKLQNKNYAVVVLLFSTPLALYSLERERGDQQLQLTSGITWSFK
jgi:hypothetical protein